MPSKHKMNGFVLMWAVAILSLIITSTLGSLSGLAVLLIPFAIILLLYKCFRWHEPDWFK